MQSQEREHLPTHLMYTPPMRCRRSVSLSGFALAAAGWIPALLLAAPTGAPPQENTPESSAEIHNTPAATRTDLGVIPFNDHDDILTRLRDNLAEHDAIFPHGPISVLHSAWRPLADELDNSLGLRLGAAYTFVYQRATSGITDRDAAGGDVDLFGRWLLFGEPQRSAGQIGFSLEERHTIATDIDPLGLGQAIGSLWETTGGFNEQDFVVSQLWWQQHLADGAFAYRIGKIDITDLLDTNRLKSFNFLFQNRAFSSNPVTAFPGNGLGAAVGVFGDRFYAGAAVGDANGRKSTSGFNSIDEGEWFVGGEIGFTPPQGAYRLAAWHTDARSARGTPSDAGFSLSFDHELDGGVVPFLRYSYADRAVRGREQILAGGAGFFGTLGREDDVAGVAASWGKSADPNQRDQYAFEAFYRIQLTRVIQVTPSAQLIVDPSLAPNEDTIGLFGIRVRIQF